MAERDPAISRYIASARAVPALSREEETTLARRWRDDSDARAAERLIRANLRHVVAIAISYRRYGLRIADLVSEGNLGLMMALRKFDPERGVRFVTYGAYWTRAYILNFVIKSWSMVGGGSGPLRSKLFFKLRRERAMVQNLVGQDDSAGMAMLAERIGTTVEHDDTSLAEIGRRLGVSRERARQLETRAIEKLRKQLATLVGAIDLRDIFAPA